VIGTRFLTLACSAILAAFAAAGAMAADKTLRLQMLSDVDVLDPARGGSLSALYTVAPLFHQLLTYDYLARPVRMIPYAAEALPEVSKDGRTYTLRIRTGLLFAPHPAFGGKPRELTAQDFVYSVQRIADPATSSMSFAQFEGLIEGLDDLVNAARREKRPFDYRAPIAGLRALDPRTLQIRLTRPDPAFASAGVLRAMGIDADNVIGRRRAWDPSAGGPAPMLEGGEPLVSSGSGTYSIDSRARLRDGREAMLRVVVRAGGNGLPGSAYTPLRWEEGASPR